MLEATVTLTQPTRLQRQFVTGDDIDPKAVEEAIRLSEKKYCSVEAMLRHTADISTTYEILPAPSAARAA